MTEEVYLVVDYYPLQPRQGGRGGGGRIWAQICEIYSAFAYVVIKLSRGA